MKLRSILTLLSVLVVLSVSTGGFLYYTALRDATLQEAEQQTYGRAKLLNKHISRYLLEHVKAIQALAKMIEFRAALKTRRQVEIQKANEILDIFKKSLDIDVCYVMSRDGVTFASSNRNQADSFVGRDFSFRPYFRKAIGGTPATYLALGTTSQKRGIYYSYPIRGNGDALLGVVVIKDSIDRIESELSLRKNETLLVIDPRSVIFISNRRDWLYKTLWEISVDQRKEILRSRQFGEGELAWTGHKKLSLGYVVNRHEKTYRMYQSVIEGHPGWKTVYLVSPHVMNSVWSSLYSPTVPIIVTLCVLIGLLVSTLYWKASSEINRRMAVETALRESEKRHRTLYHNTPAMLHSIDMSGRLISVSDYWTEALGYRREEVVGKHLTELLTEGSRKQYHEKAFPEFLKTGGCTDIPYRFKKKDGHEIDVLLSAIAERNPGGKPVRSLAVSIDVTECYRTEKELKLAKEKLSEYSKDLERQVRERTREITDIITYTPAVIYIKSATGHYRLVNPRFEAIFGVRNEEIQGRTDNVLPKAVACQFREHDQRVLEQHTPWQGEEIIEQEDGQHTYLTTKFLIFDDAGKVNAVCSISTDITDLKRAQDQLRRLSGSIMAKQEKERSALARELHDELGQVLTALRMDSMWIKERAEKFDSQVVERTLMMCGMIDKTIEELRALVFRLRPDVLDNLGLVEALELITSDFEKRLGIACVYEHDNVSKTTEGVATAAYRITQEALTNVARHASADSVEVLLHQAEGVLSLTVIDDGRGFDETIEARSDGLGLAGMRERAHLAGGELKIRSKVGQGTSVLFVVHLESAGP